MIHLVYPDLSLAQIHSALSYYYAHQSDMDAAMEREDADEVALRAANPAPVTREAFLGRLGRAA